MDPQPMEPEIDDPTESEIKLLATIADLREKLAAQQAIIDKLPEMIEEAIRGWASMTAATVDGDHLGLYDLIGGSPEFAEEMIYQLVDEVAGVPIQAARDAAEKEQDDE